MRSCQNGRMPANFNCHWHIGSMSDEAKRKREKQNERKKNRKIVRDAAKALGDERERSRHEVMSAMVPSATRKEAGQDKKKKKKSWMKKAKKHMQKNMKNKALENVAKEKLSKKKALEDGGHEKDDAKSKQEKLLPLEDKKDEKGSQSPIATTSMGTPDSQIEGGGRSGSSVKWLEVLCMGGRVRHCAKRRLRSNCFWRKVGGVRHKGDRKAWVKKAYLTVVGGMRRFGDGPN